MSTLVSTVRSTRWIDLSPQHKELRIFLEAQVKDACVEKRATSPIMVKGAFGIGKTNTLHYLFHYGWTVLQTPVFFVSLEQLILELEELAIGQVSGKINNVQLGEFLNTLIQKQINSIQEDDWKDVYGLYFDYIGKHNLDEYLVGFNPVKITEEVDGEFVSRNLPVFNKEAINLAIKSGNRPLLLIDEFERKYYKLKGIMEASGGGVLTELFDAVVNNQDLFYLIIGNGPASGYEMDRTNSETAANRRLQSRQIPFPTPNLLSESYLKGEPKGYINFIWWLSRCRPGHVDKLKGALGSYKGLQPLNFGDFIGQSKIFKESIDDQGEAVIYLKTNYFNNVPGKVEGAILKDLLISLAPQKKDIKELKTELKDCVNFFNCSSAPINVEREVLAVLKQDIYEGQLLRLQEEGRYSDVNYIDYIRTYFGYFLNAISDENGDIAFGMINDSKPDEVLCTNFLLPLLNLTYDFISIYEDDSLKEVKQSLDFLLELINLLNDALDNGEVETVVPNTFDLYERCKLLRNDAVYLQLSLHSIRESIEQPIGSPIITYKTKKLNNLIDEINEDQAFPIVFHEVGQFQSFFVPELPEAALKGYLKSLKNHLFNDWNNKYHKSGDKITRIIYLEKHDLIEDLKKEVLHINGDTDTPEPISILKKFDIVSIDTFNLNFSSQIKDFIDSIAKISIIAEGKGELNWFHTKEPVPLSWLVGKIKNPAWTEKKEMQRTIEHYEKVLFDGENAAINTFLKDSVIAYSEQLKLQVCSKEDIQINLGDYRYLDRLEFDGTENNITKRLILVFLFDNKEVPKALSPLLKTLSSELKFIPDSSDHTKQISFLEFEHFLSKNTEVLKQHFEDYDPSSSFITSLQSFTNLLLSESELTSFDDYTEYLDTYTDHFIRSYHKALGYALRSDLTESLYNIGYANEYNLLDRSKEIEALIQTVETELSTVRSNLSRKLEDLKVLLNEKEAVFTYNDMLGKAASGLVKIKMLFDENKSFTVCVLLYSSLQHFQGLIQKVRTFSSQIEQIVKDLEVQKNNIDSYQEKINALYDEDPFIAKILDLDFPKRLDNDFLYNTIFIQSVKRYEPYIKLFSGSRAYNPFTHTATIYEDKLKDFSQLLATIYEKKKVDFEERVSKLSSVATEAGAVLTLESYVNQLITKSN